MDTDQKAILERWATKQGQNRPRGRVIIFAKWCKGCRLCVEFCPRGVLAIGEDEIPYVALPENCSACRWCETHCPDLAIVVKSSAD